MRATGLDVFDETLQVTHVWLDELTAELGPDRHAAWHMLGAVLRALRDRLPGLPDTGVLGGGLDPDALRPPGLTLGLGDGIAQLGEIHLGGVVDNRRTLHHALRLALGNPSIRWVV